ncbi:HRDC domain-containing protein [Arthrobacter castelli]|uniref:HRDC domain-containing protein n=1 Tax=Arthrobacter castelli TaxID=271431 RepID=UPI0004142F72|nr:HRDC domain-containing protein [Arthrobacter castelli]
MTPQPPETAPSAEEPEHHQEPPTVQALTEPRDGVPRVIATAAGLQRAAEALASGTGPASIDAERASGFRYGQRAFLVQIRREAAGTWLIDPEPFDDLKVIDDALSGVEWILHAASQDLPCLAELGMWPDQLFDTELAARLAGLPRVGLAAVVENLLGLGLAKEHSAVDWSTRPLPQSWLGYAALDVEVLGEVRDALRNILEAEGKLGFAVEEFEAIVNAGVPEPRADPWRRTSGLHQLRERRKLEAVRRLWLARDRLASNRDVAPGRLIPDSAIVAAAKAMPATVPALLSTSGFHGRAAKREAPRWLRCIDGARRATTLPPMHLPSTSPPPPRVWADRDPAAAARLATTRNRLGTMAEELHMPVENLLTPDTLRRIAWQPPAALTASAVAADLAERGARRWQRELVADVIAEAFNHPDPLPEKSPGKQQQDKLQRQDRQQQRNQ